MPSNVIGKVTGGSKLHIKVQETVFHPGHYRISLAVNSRTELPADLFQNHGRNDVGERL